METLGCFTHKSYAYMYGLIVRQTEQPIIEQLDMSQGE